MAEDYEYVYQDTTLVPIPPTPGWGLFPDIFGQTPMQGQLRAIPGHAWQPGITFDGDSRTGIFQPYPYAIAWAIFGHMRFLVDDRGTSYLNVNGKQGTLSADLLTQDQDYYLPNQSGIIALEESFTKINGETFSIQAGQIVALLTEGHCQLANANDFGTRAIGVSLTTAGMGYPTPIKTKGLFTLADWTNVIGTPDLTVPAEYFLGVVDGSMTVSPVDAEGNILQFIGRAITEKTLLLDLARPIQL